MIGSLILSAALMGGVTSDYESHHLRRRVVTQNECGSCKELFVHKLRRRAKRNRCETKEVVVTTKVRRSGGCCCCCCCCCVTATQAVEECSPPEPEQVTPEPQPEERVVPPAPNVSCTNRYQMMAEREVVLWRSVATVATSTQLTS